MSGTVANRAPDRHRLLSDVPEPTMAKAELEDVRKADEADGPTTRELLGRVLMIVQGALLLKEFADRLQRDERQVARWIEGKERFHLDAVWDVEEFREPFLIALARLHGYASVRTTVEFERR